MSPDTAQSLYPGLSDSELFKVAKPAQYLGGELNAVQKDTASVHYRACLSFPDLYEVGMSNQAIQILYKIINDIPAAYAERVFMPASDLENLLRAQQVPLVSLETKTPLANFDLVGFS